MKMSKGLLFTYLSFFFAISSFAGIDGEDDTTGVVDHSTKFQLEKYTAARAESDETDLRRIEFGVRYMPTFSSIDVNTYNNGVIEGKVKMSNGFGIMTAVNLTKHFGVQAEANYYQISQKYSDRNLNHDLKINYLNIPVLLSFNTNKTAPVNLNFVAGPQFGFTVGSKFETSGNGNIDSTRAVVALRKGDIGFAYGAGLEFALNPSHTFRLDIGYRGFYGLVNMDASTNDQGTYNVIVSASRKTYGGYAGLTWMF